MHQTLFSKDEVVLSEYYGVILTSKLVFRDEHDFSRCMVTISKFCKQTFLKDALDYSESQVIILPSNLFLKTMNLIFTGLRLLFCIKTF